MNIEYSVLPSGTQMCYIEHTDNDHRDDPRPLDDTRDVQNWEQGEATHIWYWYASGDYYGAGFALVRTPVGTYDVFDLCHRTCYSPTDDIRPGRGEYPILSIVEKKMLHDGINVTILTDQARQDGFV